MIDYNLIKGSIFGGAVGDALGLPVEMRTRESVREIGIKDLEDNMIWFSDDTSMTLASMDALITNGFNSKIFMNNFIDWYYNGKYTTIGFPYGCGNSTKIAIENYYETGTIDITNNFRNNGNGSLMRITPVCLALLKTKRNWDDIVNILNSITKLTHDNDINKMANVMYCIFLDNLIKQKDKNIAYKNMVNFDYKKYFSEETINEFKDLLKPYFDNTEPKNERNFYVVDTLKSVIYCIMTNNNFEDSIKCAINLGYDTDTIASITGNIAGILYGYNSIPKKWLYRLNGKDLINDLVLRFSNKYGKESEE